MLATRLGPRNEIPFEPLPQALRLEHRVRNLDLREALPDQGGPQVASVSVADLAFGHTGEE